MAFPQDQEIAKCVAGAIGGCEPLMDVSLPAAIGKTNVAVDSIVVGTHAVCAVKLFDASGTVSGEPDDMCWEVVGSNGKKHTVDNPFFLTRHVAAAIQKIDPKLLGHVVVVAVFPEEATLTGCAIDESRQGNCLICTSDDIEARLSRWASSAFWRMSKSEIVAARKLLYPFCHEGRMEAISGKVKMTPKQALNTRRIKAKRRGRKWPVVAVVVVCLVVAFGVLGRGGGVKTGVSVSSATNTAIASADSVQSGDSSRIGGEATAEVANAGSSNIRIDNDTASAVSGKKGDTYIDGKGFAAMIDLEKQATSLNNQVMSVWDAEGQSLTADQVATYASKISALKSQYDTCKYHSSYQEFMQLSYDSLCLLEAFVADVGKGYAPAALNSIVAQLNSTNESKRASLESALSANGVDYTVASDGTVNLHYYDY